VSETNAASHHLCKVSHVADRGRHYPGEDVALSTRVEALGTLPGFTLRVAIPTGMLPGDTLAPGNAIPQLRIEPEARYLIWRVEGPVEAGVRYDYQITAVVDPTPEDRTLESSARATIDSLEGEPFSTEETIPIVVLAKGRYLRYLPAVYHRDDLMGRFLMLFESFWDPIEKQIAQIPAYFDPKMTPSDFLPWLASWFSLVLDERCSEPQRRELIRLATSLYRKRGTKSGLREYLEAYTGEKIEVIEHRGNNFVLGAEGKLGPGIALGTQNRPHTFTVIVHAQANQLADEDSAHKASERIAAIRTLIDAEKPAYTGYTLRVEP
jgi:phage tail-like protein